MAGGCVLAVLRIEMGKLAPTERSDQNPLNEATFSSQPSSGILLLNSDGNYVFHPNRLENGASPPSIKINKLDCQQCDAGISPQALQLLLKIGLPVIVRLEPTISDTTNFGIDKNAYPSKRSKKFRSEPQNAVILEIPPVIPSNPSQLCGGRTSANPVVLLKGEIAIERVGDKYSVTIANSLGAFSREINHYPIAIRPDFASKARTNSFETFNPNEDGIVRNPSQLVLNGDQVIVPCEVNSEGYLLPRDVIIIERPSANADEERKKLVDHWGERISKLLDSTPKIESAREFDTIMREVDKIQTIDSYKLVIETMSSVIDRFNKVDISPLVLPSNDREIDILSSLVSFLNTAGRSISTMLEIDIKTRQIAHENMPPLRERINALIQKISPPAVLNSIRNGQTDNRGGTSEDSIGKNSPGSTDIADPLREELYKLLRCVSIVTSEIFGQ
jgi:hypothetical protein